MANLLEIVSTKLSIHASMCCFSSSCCSDTRQARARAARETTPSSVFFPSLIIRPATPSSARYRREASWCRTATMIPDSRILSRSGKSWRNSAFSREGSSPIEFVSIIKLMTPTKQLLFVPARRIIQVRFAP
ncbi:hypothetical protein TGPRC2_289030 [Toxoplasma gondii TgCatPRC2]|uniref:Uncharacterized protein n=3 Tax=Toxoplasma gondii TaxID=5811 RepID=A0A151HJG8_TOXGO|nr:hypothetical protein TGME49_289030 [Toxoplasma gondii ME49]EPT27902.1 hypothetical protein TGME49_289030 [Toxoplasma gondii ME49]KYF45209.1 hypothetical protein TGARI_289030 [Toxoplasma gondii ARI]KYK69486.1 hypothetical protein TGPRC2_289030 [Toxoplasma gondii TgCatPRC2]|eukprot:XP_018636382.1 hypothetical protein TGME49_289030 [Toxoplasma gondii ME49]